MTRRPGGGALRARAGAVPKARNRASMRGRIIPSCTSPGTMRRRLRPGPAAGCRPRPSGNAPPAAGGPTRASHGATRSPTTPPSSPATSGRATFPATTRAPTAFLAPRPVAAFAPNGLGLFNMVGNTWEWCADAFRVRSLARAAKAPQRGGTRCRRAPAQGRLLSVPSLLLLSLSDRRAHRRQRRQLDGPRRLPSRVRQLATRQPSPLRIAKSKGYHYAACQPRRDHVG